MWTGTVRVRCRTHYARRERLCFESPLEPSHEDQHHHSAAEAADGEQDRVVVERERADLDDRRAESGGDHTAEQAGYERSNSADCAVGGDIRAAACGWRAIHH